MTDFRADLHCHSTCSDGTDAPLDLLRMAKAAGLSGLSITDHDTVDAYTPELYSLANELQIRLLPGIELSSEWEHHAVHILGYNIDINDPAFKDYLLEMNRRRKSRNEAILAKLKAKGFDLSIDELGISHTIGRPHIALAMMRKGYVSSVQEAFHRYLAEGAPCYAPGIKYTPAETIEQIHRAGGKAIIAHPHFIKNHRTLKHLLALPFDGIECYYGNLRQEKNWLAIAKAKNWIATGGSDYHGAVKPGVVLGSSWAGENVFNALTS